MSANLTVTVVRPHPLLALMNTHHQAHQAMEEEIKKNPQDAKILLDLLPHAQNAGIRDLLLDAIERKTMEDFEGRTVLEDAYHACKRAGMDESSAYRLRLLNNRLFIQPRIAPDKKELEELANAVQ